MQQMVDYQETFGWIFRSNANVNVTSRLKKMLSREIKSSHLLRNRFEL